MFSVKSGCRENKKLICKGNRPSLIKGLHFTMVGITVQEAKIDQMQTPLLVIGIFENEHDFFASKELDSTISSAIIELHRK